MVHPYPFQVSIFRSLYHRDVKFAEKARRAGCPHCGGPLHHAFYRRKPRESPIEIPPQYCFRRSLCCGREGCRKRFLPPSCLFMGRKVHWRVTIIVALAIRQERAKQEKRTDRVTAEEAEGAYGVPVRTLVRYTAFFRDEFVHSAEWKRVQGQVTPTVSRSELPGSLVAHVMATHDDTDAGLVACLLFLAAGEVDDDVQAR